MKRYRQPWWHLTTAQKYYKELYTKDINVNSNTFYNRPSIFSFTIVRGAIKKLWRASFIRRVLQFFILNAPEQVSRFRWNPDRILSYVLAKTWVRWLWILLTTHFKRVFILDEQGRACLTLIPKGNEDYRYLKNGPDRSPCLTQTTKLQLSVRLPVWQMFSQIKHVWSNWFP